MPGILPVRGQASSLAADFPEHYLFQHPSTEEVQKLTSVTINAEKERKCQTPGFQ